MNFNSENAETVDFNKLRVCFVIMTNGNGLGGHYRSLKTVAELIADFANVEIVNLGARMSPVFEGMRAKYIYFNGLNYLEAFSGLRKILSSFHPDVIHSYDVGSHFFSRIYSFFKRIPLVHTKCGGGNPKKYYPYADSLICFSRENLRFFKSLKKFSDSSLYLIPNRVREFSCSSGKTKFLLSKIPKGRKVILRISRISSHYASSLRSSIGLVDELNRRGVNCCLVIVGSVENNSVSNSLRGLNSKNVVIVTDDRVTENAREILNVADVVIGTGRGFMEAASKSKVLLAPVKGLSFPLLVNKEVWEGVFDTNFSERGEVAGVSDEENLKSLVVALTNERMSAELSKFSRSMYERHFDIEAALEVYRELYKRSKVGGRVRPIDCLLNAYLCSSGLLKTRYLSSKHA